MNRKTFKILEAEFAKAKTVFLGSELDGSGHYTLTVRNKFGVVGQIVGFPHTPRDVKHSAEKARQIANNRLTSTNQVVAF